MGLSDSTTVAFILVIVLLVGGVIILSISICVISWFRNSQRRQFDSISSMVALQQNLDNTIIKFSGVMAPNLATIEPCIHMIGLDKYQYR